MKRRVIFLPGHAAPPAAALDRGDRMKVAYASGREPFR